MMKNNPPSIIAIIPAAGIGSRMQSEKPKQYLPLADGTVLSQTLAQIAACPLISEIRLAIKDGDPFIGDLALPEKVVITQGGKERADSVLNALLAKPAPKNAWALVHDAARPLLTQSDLEQLIAKCTAIACGGILAYRAKDTLKSDEAGVKTLDRAHIWHALTPQLFPFQELSDALTHALEAGAKITDEASAIEWAGGQVQLVPGRSDNIKITTPEDLALAEFILQSRRGAHSE